MNGYCGARWEYRALASGTITPVTCRKLENHESMHAGKLPGHSDGHQVHAVVTWMNFDEVDGAEKGSAE